MKQVNQNGLSWLEFPHLSGQPLLAHAVFTRTNGYSSSPFDSLNVGLHVGDRETHVRQNRKAVLSCFDAMELIEIQQVHGSRILVLDGHDLPDGFGADREMARGDALITNLPGKLLLIQVADCQPVMIHDPVRRVIANIHSGWRGSIVNIIGRAVTTMKERFGCRPRHLLAGIGPSLGPCCAEFIHYRKEIPQPFWRYLNGSRHFDFWSLSRDQLVAAGVPPDHIQTSELCTRCRPDLFFSYRHTKVTGRLAAVIGLRGAGSG
ncbi:MAG: peptidoglycan editing factor PgeF [Thermodesulfobacteriota bacterium]